MPGITGSDPWLALAAAAVALTGCSTTPPAADTDTWPASAEHRPAGCEGSQYFIVHSA